MLEESPVKTVAWVITDRSINDLQISTIGTMVQRAKQAHYCNVYMRINGRDELYEADWIKHMGLGDLSEFEQNSGRKATLEWVEKATKVIEAAKWANYCPDAGGYRDGRSVEDCYEELNDALNEFYGVNIEVPMEGWLTEVELDELLSGQPLGDQNDH